MAGILDSKTRIMDLIITREGRRQMSSGKLRAEFVSFTDCQAFYEASEVSGSTDASERIYFEAISREQDMITLETDDSGNLLGFDTDNRVTLVGDKLFTVTESIPEDPDAYNFRLLNTGSSFASVGNLIATSSINNFKNQYLIGTRDAPEFSQGDGFTLSTQKVDFTIVNSSPFGDGPSNHIININAVEPLFLDKRLSHLPNFKFLPPETHDGNALGNYVNLNQRDIITYEELMDDLKREVPTDTTTIDQPFNTEKAALQLETNFTDVANESAKPRTTIKFIETSEQSNIVAQVFETNVDDATFRKLDVIDFGVFYDSLDEIRPEKHVFFVGKVYIDSNSLPTFVNLFTLIMD